jgi:tetratricopeptide (TPR) repeat protein
VRTISNKRRLTAVACAFLCVNTSVAQTKRPAPTRNAALRYWLAFADLQDPPSDKTTADLLQKTAAGEAAWDEAKLGPILDKNEDAVRGMLRATKLPECDWGLEYDLGPRASIGYAPRARVLARLNTLYGMRLAAKGNAQEAVDAWLAGIRFSEHLAQGGSLVFSFIAKMGLLSNFRALTQAAQNGALTPAERTEVEEVVRALPETGFDWSAALGFEAYGLDVALKELKESTNPAEYYQELTGNAARQNFEVNRPLFFVGPTVADTAAFRKAVAAAERALQLKPERARERLKTLQDSIEALPFYREFTPSLVKINQSRAEVEAAREHLLQALAMHQPER